MPEDSLPIVRSALVNVGGRGALKGAFYRKLIMSA